MRLSFHLFTVLVFAILGRSTSAQEFGVPAVGWPEHELGYSIYKDRNEFEVEHFGDFRLAAIEADRQLIAYDEKKGLAVVRSTDEQFLYLRTGGRDTEMRIGGADRIYGRATFSRDSSLVILRGIHFRNYSTKIDCHDVETGELVWTRTYNYSADVSVLAEADSILIGGVRVQDLDGIDAFQLLDLKTGSLVDRLERVDLQGSGNMREPWVAARAGVWVFPFQYRLLRVDGGEGSLDWIPASVDRNSLLSPDGRYLAEWANQQVSRTRIVEVISGNPLYSFSEFDGFGATLELGTIAWSRDSRHLYLSRAGGSIEKWDFAQGLLVGTMSAGPFRFSKLEESSSGDRLYVLNQLESGDLRFFEFDTETFNKLDERSWEQDSHASEDRFGIIVVGGAWDLGLDDERSEIRLSLNSKTYVRSFSGGAFRELDGGATPRWVSGASYVSETNRFRIVWSDGEVEDFDATTLESLGSAWRSPLLGFATEVAVNPNTGVVGAKVLNDYFVFDAESGQEVHTTSGLRSVYPTGGISETGRFAVLDKTVAGGESERGVFDFGDSRYLLPVSGMEGWTEYLELSPSGGYAIRLSRHDGDSIFEAFDLRTGESVARREFSARYRSFAFSRDERFVYFVADELSPSSSYQSQIWRLDIEEQTFEMLVDLGWMGSNFRPYALSLLEDQRRILVRTPLDSLYVVDPETGGVSAIKSMRNIPTGKTADVLESEMIATGPASYLFFAGTGRAEIGPLVSAEHRHLGFGLVSADRIRIEVEGEDGAFRLMRANDDDRIWLDDGMPFVGPEIDLEKLEGKFVRLVY